MMKNVCHGNKKVYYLEGEDEQEDTGRREGHWARMKYYECAIEKSIVWYAMFNIFKR